MTNRTLLIAGTLLLAACRTGAEDGGAEDAAPPQALSAPPQTSAAGLRDAGSGGRVTGTQGDDRLSGTSEADTIVGGEGADVIEGGDGDDVIYGDTDGGAPLPILMPIEVMGSTERVVSVRFELGSGDGIDALSMTCHRCGYRDRSAKETPTKAFVRLNGGEWVPVSDEVATVAEPERRYGGIDGAYNTVRLTLPISGAVAGVNTLDFRYAGTDGFTTGYRVLAFDLLKAGRPQVSPRAFTQDDPAGWAAPRPRAADIAAGEALWEAEDLLRESPLGDRTLHASCASCHASEGEDLKYFNYSNRSIVERSRFHGLTAAQGEQIASYIRTRPAPAPKGARPWNPPYQPGPGLDARPATEWAAGAGLDWVLDDDAEMLAHIFPGGTTSEAIAAVASTRDTMNVREMPIALQLPDWNDWLAEEHPAEPFMWGDRFYEEVPHTTYRAALDALDAGGAALLRETPSRVAAGDLLALIDDQAGAATSFLKMGGPQPCRNTGVHNSPAFTLLERNRADRPTSADFASGDPDFCERWMRSVLHWSAVKQWEVQQRFALDDAAPDVYPYGEARSWLGSRRQVFGLAPHRSGNDSYQFSHTSRAHGAFLNAAWYQLQVILNAGNRNPQNHRPPDWKYQMNHTFASVRDNDHPQSLRYVQSLIKMSQNLDMRRPEGAQESALPFEDRGPTSNGWWVTHVTPWRFVSIGGSFFNVTGGQRPVWDELDSVEPGLKNKVQNALLEAWLDKTETYDPSEFPRGDGSQNKVNEVDYVPTPWSGSGQVSNSGTHADGVYRAIPMMREDGMDEALIERLRLWGAAMWPAGDWDALRAPGAPEPVRFLRSVPGQTGAEASTDNQTSTAWEASLPALLTLRPEAGYATYDRLEVELSGDADYAYTVETGDGRVLATGRTVRGRTVQRIALAPDERANTVKLRLTDCRGACETSVPVSEARLFGVPG